MSGGTNAKTGKGETKKKNIYGERKKELKSGITERAGEIKEKINRRNK